jgi:hypothetical protein
MKKFIVLGLFGLLIIAFSATAYAQPKLEFKASGFMEATSFWHRNIANGVGTITTIFNAPFWPNDPLLISHALNYGATGAWDRTNSFMEYRGVLRFDAIMGKELSGTVIFEMDSTRWGDASPAGAQRGQTGFWTADRAAVEIKNLYLDFALPYFGIPAPMTVRVGIQPLGIRPHIFMITDGAGITGGIKIDPVSIGLTWGKAWEGQDARAEDVDIYGASISAKIGPITPGFFAYNFNMNSYPIPNAAAATAYGVNNANNEANMWWLGLYLDGKLGPLNLNFDFVYDIGKVKRRPATAAQVQWSDVKYRGWALQTKIQYPWEKFNFGGLFTYASGADLRKTSLTGNPGDPVADATAAPGVLTTKVGSYVIPPGSEEWAAWGESMILSNNYITATAAPIGMWPNLGLYPTQMTRGAIGGTWILKLFASFTPITWYKVTFQGMYIGDTTKHGNTLGDALRASGVLRDDKTIGWELDLINDIQLYKNLKWSIGLGWLFAGNALDQGVKDLALGIYPAPLRNMSPKDPWIIATKLRYDF